MHMSRCISVDSALYELYDPKQKKASRGVNNNGATGSGTPFSASVGRFPRFLFLVAVMMAVSSLCLSLQLLCYIDGNFIDVDALYARFIPCRQLTSLRHSRTFFHSRPLAIRNAPQTLAWKKAEAYPRTSEIKELSVDFATYFNPSILEVESGRHMFSLRMGWLYKSGCERFINEAATEKEEELLVEAIFLCLKHHKERFVDQTLLGEYDPISYSLIVRDQGPAPTALVTHDELQDFDFSSWDSGAFWHDTRLVHPYNFRPVSERDQIFMTSQSIEILTHKEFKVLGKHSHLVLHLTHLAALDPESILLDKTSTTSADSAMVERRQHRMTRWLYYDKELERQEWQSRSTQNDYQWKLSSFDVARMKCRERPDELPALPFNPNKRVDEAIECEERMSDQDWYFVKDKNWSPFVYNDSVLWSYSLFPNHVVCENDVDLRQLPEGIDNVECVLCVTKYNSSSISIAERFYNSIHDQGFENVVGHLNGAPSYFIPEKNLYLGVMHIIKENHTTDDLGWEKRTKTYEHYFYALDAVPPFALKAISSVRVPLERSRGYSHWFDIDDTVIVEFVMYMQYHPDRPGREIVISYGDGDRHARVATLPLDDVLASFDFGAVP